MPVLSRGLVTEGSGWDLSRYRFPFWSHLFRADNQQGVMKVHVQFVRPRCVSRSRHGALAVRDTVRDRVITL
jgi:hypothetical protein